MILWTQSTDSTLVAQLLLFFSAAAAVAAAARGVQPHSNKYTNITDHLLRYASGIVSVLSTLARNLKLLLLRLLLLSLLLPFA